MTTRSFCRSFPHIQLSTLNLRGRVAPAATNKLGLVRLAPTSGSTNTSQFSLVQMARRKRDNQEKGIKRKRPKQETPYFGGRFAQARASRDAAMNRRNDDGPGRGQPGQAGEQENLAYEPRREQVREQEDIPYEPRRDQARQQENIPYEPGRDQARERENLASELWNQQQQQYHQQPVYPAPSWPQPPFGTQFPPVPPPPPPKWPQAPSGAPFPPLPHNFNPQSASFSPSWGPAGWAPLPNHPIPPPPPPLGGFPPWGPNTGFPPRGQSYPDAAPAINNGNSPYFHDQRGGTHDPYHTRPFSSGPDSRRGYSTSSYNNHARESGRFPRDPNEIILTDNETQSPPPPSSSSAPKKSKRSKKKAAKAHPKEEAKLAPSAASGGVPDPTPEYLAQASQRPVELPSGSTPRQILVVIDLNGTLVFRKDPKKHPQRCTLRPHAEAFLAYCFKHHKVAIWSSAQPKNVRIMVESLLPSQAQRDQLVLVWGRDKFGLTAEDSARRIQCYKRLTLLWESEEVKATGQWDQNNTVLIDDSIEKARSEPYNAITLPEFEGNLKETPVVLELVQDYLDILAKQADISSYIRLHPFMGAEPGETTEANALAKEKEEGEVSSGSGQETTATAAAEPNPDEIELDLELDSETPGGEEAHEKKEEESVHPTDTNEPETRQQM